MSRKTQKQPTGFGAFDTLVRKLVEVPKSELDTKRRQYERAKAKRAKRGR